MVPSAGFPVSRSFAHAIWVDSNRAEVDKATVESADVNEYNFRAMDDLSVPYTQVDDDHET